MKAKRVTSKFLALIMALAMVLVLLPATAWATESKLKFDWEKMHIKEGDPVTTKVGVTGNDAGCIMVVANYEGENKVTCTGYDSTIITVKDGEWKDKRNCWLFEVDGLKVGTTTVKVAAVANPADYRVLEVEVTPSPLVLTTTSVAIAKADTEIIGGYYDTEEEGVSTDIICTSDDTDIATVEDLDTTEGKYHLWKITPVAVGDTSITVKTVATDGKEPPSPKATEEISVSVKEHLLTVKQTGEEDVTYDGSAFYGETPDLTPAEVPTWSGRNHYYSFKKYDEESSVGPTLQTILEDAMGEEAVANLPDDQLIELTASDHDPDAGKDYSQKFTAYELLRESRYYFPNIGKNDVPMGAAATQEQKAGAQPVQTLLCKPDCQDARLVVGQVAPNERNRAASLQNMTTGGTITVLDERASKLVCDVKANVPNGSTIEPGTEIVLDSPTIIGDGMREIYYTTDGSDPDKTTAPLYYYRTQKDKDTGKIVCEHGTIKAPDTEGTFVVKAKQTAYGYLDSEVKTFTYKVEKKVAAGRTYEVSGAKYKVDKVATDSTQGVATFVKAKNAKSVSVPKTVVLADGKVYAVTTVAAKAFTGKKTRTVTFGANVKTIKANAMRGSKATKIIVKTKKLTKKSVKNSLKGSKVKTVQVKVGAKKLNKKYVKKYKKFFTKKNAGKKVRVK